MALHGEIKINGVIIGGWVARRVEMLDDPDGEYLYHCHYFEEGPSPAGNFDDIGSLEFTVAHRYSDGAAALARKVLTAGEGGW